jgi:hypothetical protein
VTRTEVSEAQREAWWGPEDHEPPVTHVITWNPTLRVTIAIAPWEDPDEILAARMQGWADNLEDGRGEWLTEVAEPPGDDVFTHEVTITGSTGEIQEFQESRSDA